MYMVISRCRRVLPTASGVRIKTFTGYLSLHILVNKNGLLPDLYLATRANACWDRTGVDDPRHCRDAGAWHHHEEILYEFNSRGFRDREWPDDLLSLQSCLWCVGDSYTVGIGQPSREIWCQQLERLTMLPTINVSMDGASNAWIARRARQILTEVRPRILILHWSFTHRREDSRQDLPDELRRIWHSAHEDDDGDFRQHIVGIEGLDTSTRVIHSTIPWFSPNPVVRELVLKKHVGPGRWLAHFDFQDHARDGYHYGPKTAFWLARQLADLAA